MKKQYLTPSLGIYWVTVKAPILTGSNGENLRMTTYGSRGDEDDDLDGFWD